MSATVESFSCGYCGGWGHQRPERCPRVRSVEYHENGTVKRVEFKEPGRV